MSQNTDPQQYEQFKTPPVASAPAPTEPTGPTQQAVPPPEAPQFPAAAQTDPSSTQQATVASSTADQSNTQPPTPAPAGPALPHAPPDGGSIEWTASEYVHHDKGRLWFVGLAGVTLAGAALAAYLSQWLFAVLIVVMGVALGIFAGRPPREIRYRIAPDGLTVGERTFPLSHFKAFGVLSEGAFYSVQLQPAKRFMPGVSIYFSETEGEKIFDVLAAYLPVEDMKPDLMDRLMHWLRF